MTIGVELSSQILLINQSPESIFKKTLFLNKFFCGKSCKWLLIVASNIFVIMPKFSEMVLVFFYIFPGLSEILYQKTLILLSIERVTLRYSRHAFDDSRSFL